VEKMSAELFDELEGKVCDLIALVSDLRLENGRLKQENGRLSEERGRFKSRIDSILKKLEGV
jgi:cell division protein ZapB